MFKMFKHFILYCAVIMSVDIAVAQTPKSSEEVDSLLSAALKNIYENPDESIALGLAIAENPDYSKRKQIVALKLISSAYTSKRNYQKALEYIKKASLLSEAHGDQVLDIEILFQIGTLYQQLKIYDKSIESMEKVERLCLLYPIRDSIGLTLANSYIVKGFIYKDNLNCDIALEYFDKGIDEYERHMSATHTTNLSIIYYNRGNCFTLLGEYENAKNSFRKSIELAESKGATSLISFAQKGLAEVYTLEGNYNQAIPLLQTAMNQSEKVGDLILNSTIYKGLFENYLALNQWEEYQKYHDLYAKTHLEIKISERNSVSDSIEENSTLQKNRMLELDSKIENLFKWSILIIALIILIIFFVQRKNKKTIRSLQNHINLVQQPKTTSQSK